ncbi:AraC family transcriptional regulator [Hyphomonas sp.]|uniref:AraC family transcriptional regulator n=1 Tax=Hyphomonas sp. TaxID=87 RepID=UPI00391D646E
MKSTHDIDLNLRPVVGLADEYPTGFVDTAHSHERIQLLYASSGVMSVVTDKTTFVIPPQRAVWIPSQVRHEVSCRGPVSLRTLYIDPRYEREDPDCHIVEVGTLLKALILEVTQFDPCYDIDGREGQIVRLLINELLASPKVPYAAPMPADPRLVRVCREIIDNPSDQRDIDEWANVAGMSRRSFTRAFKRETGMGVALWRQQVRLLEALSLLSTGSSVTAVALDVGYDSASAFCAMFQRAFGVSPSRFSFR